MRLSRSASVSKQSRNQRLTSVRAKKKHKRLDAICEQAYNRNHRGLESKLSDCNGHDSEVRRSSRVRRAPVVLDASPPPPKKRKKNDKRSGGGIDSFGRLRGEDLKIESPCSTSKNLEEESGEWRSRLRTRAKKVRFGIGTLSPRGKRKLFGDLDGLKGQPKLEKRELDGKNEGLGGETSMVVKSKKPGRIKASNISRNGHKEIDSGNIDDDDDEKGTNEVEVLKDNNKGCLLEEETKDNYAAAVEFVEKEGGGVPVSLPSKDCSAHEIWQLEEQVKQLEQPGYVERENGSAHIEVSEVPCDQAGNGTCHDKPLKDENLMKIDGLNCTSSHKLDKPRIKEGRRCGLCGGGTNGKPPKKLVHDGAESDNEAYSGSSSSEEPNYDIWDGFGDEPSWLGQLLGPVNDRFGIAGIWVHQQCAVWSPEVYFAGLGCLKNVRAALCRGRVLKCNRCGRAGATIGCRVDRCPKTYHLPCARDKGCIFDHRKFLIACTDHRHLFQPQGSRYFYRLKKMKAKKMKLELRKQSNEAWRKDNEAEEKWLENCGEDEEFLKRESRRLQRDLLRIAPVFIGGSESENETPFQGWESVGGLQDVIQCLKEVVILPLLYPQFFNNLGLTPPRGVLLHGYPGTGKTLVVRALIGSCARGDKRIAYFARKGADCLGKYVGDAERQLRLLFQVAEKSQPSIIFFDEIDGLAPSRTRQQDQTHNSVVSTLLALMDGLKSRGSVVVIGATNRPDAIDPALRRPGRFDREIYFPLPSVKGREAILSLHTQKWPKPVSGSLLKLIARRTVGYAGADLQALCTQAAIIALRRACSWKKFLSAAGELAPQGKRPPLPTFTVEERDWLEALSCAPPPCSRREAGMAANDVVYSPLPAHLFPCLLQPLSCLLVSCYLDERIWLPPSLAKAAATIKAVIVSALDKKKVNSDCWWSHLHDLLQEADVASNIESYLSGANGLVGDDSFSGFDVLEDDNNNKNTEFEPSKLQTRFLRTDLLPSISYASGKKSGFCMLIAGSPGSGQRHLASCILHCFAGNIEIQKVDLATISQEGGGDMVQGLTQILLRCASVGTCMIFMPRIDLWALEMRQQVVDDENDSSCMIVGSAEDNVSCLTHSEVDEEKNSCPRICTSAEMEENPDRDLRISHLWSTFVEQVESMFISTTSVILATSEAPLSLLPLRIRQFFRSDTSNLGLLTRLGDTVPRFSMHVDGNFNHDMVIDSSAAKLSNDLARYFVQLVHHRAHTNANSLKEDKAFGLVEDNVDTVCYNLDPEPIKEHGYKSQNSYLLPHSKKDVKGKSNLLAAISAFGYQILQYPHFAELCWVTSKLKEGPCTEISGPWKGWPFNSCVIRPNGTSEKIITACSSSNLKSKEKYGLVRGLIAVGLSAYRGVYTSLRQVSTEVRKVLELLALHISAKIDAGKDRYQFVRILSQVAYLEDMVNSWAYTLQSLDVDTQPTEANQKLTSVGSLNKSSTHEDNLFQSDECKNQSSLELELLEESTSGLDDKDTGCLHLKGRDFSCSQSTHGVNNSEPAICFPSYTSSSNQLDAKLMGASSEVDLEPSSLGSPGNPSEFGDLKLSNGFASIDDVISPQDGPCSSCDLGGVKLCSAGKECNQDSRLSSAEMNIQSNNENSNSCGNNMDINLTRNRSAGLPIDPKDVCVYHFCSECLVNLHHLMQKVLLYQREMKMSNWTAEDVHDAVTSLSLSLHSAVIKFCTSESPFISFEKNLKHENYRTLFEGREMAACQCEVSGNRLTLAMECSCHSQGKRATGQANRSQYPRDRLETELIYKNGVLAVLDPERDVSFHCKFQTLCLCSLIEYILMTKLPSD